MSNKQAHLEMIQGVINRLSNNSFLLKGWTVVLVSAMFALAAKDTKPLFIYLAYFPVFIFWLLDGYFLWQERIFRVLYDDVRIMEEDKINFSMYPSTDEIQSVSFIAAVFSKTLAAFHGTILLVILLVMFTAI